MFAIANSYSFDKKMHYERIVCLNGRIQVHKRLVLFL